MLDKGLLAWIFTILFYYTSFSSSLDTAYFQLQCDSLYSIKYLDSSIAFAEQLNEQATHYDYFRGEVRVKTWLANTYTSKGLYDKALQYGQRILLIGEENQNQKDIANANILLANVYLAIHKYEKSIPFSLEAIRLFYSLGNQGSAAGASVNLSIAYLNMGEIQTALDTLLKLEPYFSENSETPERYYYETNLGLAYTQLGNYKKAIPSFLKQLAYKKAQKDTFYFAPSYGNLAYAYQNIGAFETAWMYYDSSLYYSKLLQQDEMTYITLLDQSDGYQLQGDFKNALICYQEYHKTYLRLINEQTQNTIATLEVEYDLEQKEKAIAESELSIKNLEQEAKIRLQQLMLMIFGLLASVAIGLLIYNKWKSDLKIKDIQKKQIQEALKNKEIEAKNLENQVQNKTSDLTNLSLNISQKNKFTDELVQRLEAIKEANITKRKEALDDVIKFVNAQSQINKELPYLQESITEINQEFYQKLDERFSNLTNNEKYISGLIRLNLSNKDIASIRGTSISSAKMSRYRLRKKLGLDPETDIVQFLQQL